MLVVFAFVAIIQPSLDYLRHWSTKCFYSHLIPDTLDTFRPEDIEYFENIAYEINPHAPENYKITWPLLWMSHKVPDSIPRIFLGEIFPVLINKDDFPEPYRSRMHTPRV